MVIDALIRITFQPRALRTVVLVAFCALANASCGGDPTVSAPGATSSTSSPADDSTDSDGNTETTGDDTDDADTGDTDGAAMEDADTEELFPDVVDVSATQDADGTWTFSVTLSSPYDSPERYADAWRVVGPDGEVFGVRELLHDHANEQPFTRSVSGVAIPDDVTTVMVEGRDQISGWGGATMTFDLPPAE